MKNYLRSFMNRESATQITKVAVIGVVNTVVHLSVFNLFRSGVGLTRFWSITIAFSTATVVSYFLNRRYTFELHDGKVELREGLQFYVVNLVAYVVTLGVVELVDAVLGGAPVIGTDTGDLSALGENFAQLAAVGIILLPKFAAYRDVVFGRALKHRAAQETTDSEDSERATLD